MHCFKRSLHDKKKGKYYTLYSNHENLLTEYYEVSPIQVTLPKEDLKEINITIYDLDNNNRRINVGKNGIIFFLTNYTLSEVNIFNSSDIAE